MDEQSPPVFKLFEKKMVLDWTKKEREVNSSL